jgi:hypothetical protein
MMVSSVFAGVTVTPSQLTFECQEPAQTMSTQSLEPLFSSTSTAIITKEPRFFRSENKILSRAMIEDDITASQMADVLITLDIEGLEDQIESRLERISTAQQQIHDLLSDENSQTMHMYANIPLLHAHINTQSLISLENSPLVAAVEPVLTFETQTSQGIPLMDGDVYRSVFGGGGVAVAILDSGIDYTHSALGNGGFPNSKVIGGYDFGNSDTDPMPSGSAHGTNCAGVSSGDAITYSDYAGGVAPDSKLYALKIMPDGSGSATTTAIANAIDWCVSHQFDDPANPILVINLSVGGGKYTSTCDSASSAITNSVNTANAAGITVLSSSGNDGYCDSMGMPACISGVISVGAVFDNSMGTFGFCVSEDSCIGTSSTNCTSPDKYISDSTQADLVASYSNSSTLVDVLASSHRAYTTSTGGGYNSSFGGTSAACAYASGAVAALQSAAADTLERFLTPEEVRILLADYGEPVNDPKNNIVNPRISVASSIENLDVFSGQQITVENTSRFAAEIQNIVYPSWMSISPSPPVSLSGYEIATFYASADCGQCNYEVLNDTVTISGTGHPQGFSESIDATLNCPLCLYEASLNSDCEVDLLDFAILADCWLSSDPICDAADIDGTMPVGQGDLLIMGEQWLGGK